MRVSKNLTDEDIKRLAGSGETGFIPEAAPFPSDIFPVGSSPLIRVYRGRSTKNSGHLVAEFNGTVTEKGLNMPEWSSGKMVNPATGQIIPMRVSFWLVRPDGFEQYSGYWAEVTANGPRTLESLLSKPPEAIN